MSAEPTTAAYLIGIAAAAQVVAQPAGLPLTDVQLLAVTVGSGLMGGLGATLSALGEISIRHLAKRCIASGMVAPAIVAGFLFWRDLQPTLFQLWAISLVAGMAAWPGWALAKMLAPEWLKKKMGIAEASVGGEGD